MADDQTEITVMDLAITCGTCGHKFVVPVPGLTPENLAATGQTEVTVTINADCPNCGQERRLPVTAKLQPPR